MLKKLFKKKVKKGLEESSDSLPPFAARAAWEEYAKEKLFDDPSEMLEAKWAFNAGFSVARELYNKEN